jgi:hypothetical protein
MIRRQIPTYSIAVVLLLASASQAVPALDLCTIPVHMNVNGQIGRCYISCIDVRARANFDAEFGLRIDEVDPEFTNWDVYKVDREFMDWDAYFDGGNQIPGDGNWHTLSICVVASNPTRFLKGPDPGPLVSRVTITVRLPAESKPVESKPVGNFVQLENCSDHRFLLQPVECVIDVDIDIKPGSCPNPLNLRSRGVLPVAILGSAEFDVSDIDAASVRLAGVGAIRSNPEDVTGPVVNGNDCACTTAEPDGIVDLTLKFRTPEIVVALLNHVGELTKGEQLALTLTGTLIDGTPIEASDCVVLVGQVPESVAATRADGNKDGKVDMRDLFLLKRYFGKSAALED